MSNLELAGGAVARAAPEKVVCDLYHDHALALRRYARRRVGRQDCEDMVQETYLRLLQDAKIGELDSPRAYLFRVASNLAIDARRKISLETRFADEAARLFDPATDRPNPHAAMDNFVRLQKFRASLDALAPICREIFLLNSMDGLNAAEIAARVGVSTRTVERHLVKARSELRARCGR